MVLSNASKQARNQQSIINRTNTCGGVKKGGLVPQVGYFISSNPTLTRGTNTQFGLKCRPDFTIQTQKYGYRATLGGVGN